MRLLQSRLGSLIGLENQQVEVSADAPLIEPTVTSLGKVVEQQELEDLPRTGGNFSQLGLCSRAWFH